jgi:copper(I)-binding protein/putative intracellular protease/amidase/DNA-directed RNA polymerase subunit RPC12/RpoP
MKRFSNRSALVLTAVFLSVFLNSFEPGSIFAHQSPDRKEYVCPPCGCDKDNDVFDKPGSCTSCGMKLVEKGSAASLSASSQLDVRRRKVAILIFDGVQIIDYTGPWEVFGQAGFEVYTVAMKADPITTNMGMKVVPGYTVENNPRPDILVVPGGGVINTQKDPKALKWVQETAEKSEIVLSVCNGAYILAKAGLLNGLTATTTAPLIEGLASAAPNIKVVYDQRFVDNGKIITTGGLSSGIDGSLHVVSRLLGRGRAQAVALGMEYDWQPEGGFVRPALADKYLNYSFAGIRGIIFNREGDAEHWENRYVATGPPSATETLELINNTLATEGHWVRQVSGKPDDTSSFWKFIDERGRQWNASASVQPLIGEKNRFLISLKVARSDSKPLAAATPVDPDKITVRDAWIQEGPPSQKLTAAFMVIENQGAFETELVSAKADIANVVELHKMEIVNEVMRMSKVELISVPAGGKAELRPSGFHLMLIGLNKEARQGDEVTVTLQFANSVQKTIRVPVRKREAMGN